MVEVDQLVRLARQSGIHDEREIQLLLNAANLTPNSKLAEKRKQAIIQGILQQLRYPFLEKTPTVASSRGVSVSGKEMVEQL